MNTRAPVIIPIIVLFSGLFACCADEPITPNKSPEVYIWQRDWTPQLRESLSQHSSSFDRLVFLNAEVVWDHNRPRVITVTPDYAALRVTGRPIGIALRV